MDFIESWLGVSPDGGNGSLEALLFALVVVVCAVILHARMPKLVRRIRVVRGTKVNLC